MAYNTHGAESYSANMTKSVDRSTLCFKKLAPLLLLL